MSEIEDIKAGAGQIRTDLERAYALITEAREIVIEQGQQATHLLTGSSQEAAEAIMWRCNASEQSLNDAQGSVGVAIDQLQMFIGYI